MYLFIICMLGLLAPASCWLAVGHPYSLAMWPSLQAISQHSCMLFQGQQETLSLQSAKAVIYNIIIRVTFYHLCHILLVRSKSQVLPFSRGGDYTGFYKGVILTGGSPLDISATLCILMCWQNGKLLKKSQPT